MDEVQAVFEVYKVKCMDINFVLEERVAFDTLGLNWRLMTQAELADKADFVVTQISTSGSEAARQVLLDQMMELLNMKREELRRVPISASSIANCARICQVMRNAAVWELLQRRIAEGDLTVE